MRTDSKVSSRQIVLFIVEGKSDKEALEMIFKFIYRNQHEIRFEFTHGDITSAPEATLETAVEDIQRKIAEVKDDIKADDDQFCRIVQIFDMDGAYIPDSAIVRKQVESFEYSLASIAYKDITTVMGRNQKNAASRISSCKWTKSMAYLMKNTLCPAILTMFCITNQTFLKRTKNYMHRSLRSK